MKKVYLHGKLAKRFGKKWVFDVRDPAGALQALDANIPDFYQYLVESENKKQPYLILRKNPKNIKTKDDFNKYHVSGDNAYLSDDGEEIHIVPVVQGNEPVSTFFALVFSTGAQALTAKAIMAKIVFAVAVAAVMNAITKPPTPPRSKDPVTTKSFLLSGGKTRMAQGIPVPIGYGRLLIGATNIAQLEEAKDKEDSSSPDGASAYESYSEKEFIDLLSEGPIDGFCNKYGAKLDDNDIVEGIYLNKVQVRNSASIGSNIAGSYNYILNEHMDTPQGRPAFISGKDNEQTVITKNGVCSIQEYDLVIHGTAPNGREGNKAQNSVEEAIRYNAQVASHTISSPFVSRVKLSFLAEFYRNTSNGQTINLDTEFRFAILASTNRGDVNIIDEKNFNGSFSMLTGAVTKVEDVNSPFNSYFNLSGLATSPHQFDIDIFFPNLASEESTINSISFKIIKLSPELDAGVTADKSKLGGIMRTRNLQFKHVVEIIDERLQYTNCALVRLRVDSKNINRIPDRNYHLRLKKVLIPSNYDAESRKYNGPWDGLFKGQLSGRSIHTVSDEDKVWTDNPAWIFYDMLYNSRYGVGKYGLDEEFIDKWQLYKIAKYCDELVESDFPIETKSFYPRRFSSFNVVNRQTSPESIVIKIDPREYSSGWYERASFSEDAAEDLDPGEIKARFEEEFGSGKSMKGRLVAFFMSQSSDNINEEKIAYNSITRDGEIKIEQRTILETNSDDLTLTVSGPMLEEINKIPLSGTFQIQSGGLYGAGSKFLTELVVGSKVIIYYTNGQNNVRQVQSIADNNNLSFSQTPDNFAVSSVSVYKTIGGCAAQLNHEVVEPRFSCNLFLTERAEALEVLKNIASVFRGMVAYNGGKIFTIQDSLKKPVAIFNNSNVSKDSFNYSGVNKNKRITAVMVRFNDKNNHYNPDLVYEEDAQAIQKFGYIEKEVLGQGITSESQARRLAKWVLMTSQLETETITFKCGLEAASLYPGSIFEVSDETRTGKFRSGRLLGVLQEKKVGLDNVPYNTYSFQLDKFTLDDVNLGGIMITVAAPKSYNPIETLDDSMAVERDSIDQDEELDAINTPQYFRFRGVLDFTDWSNSRQGQNAVITSLKLLQEFEVDPSEDRILVYQHGFSDGDNVAFYTDGVLPGGLSASQVYTIKDKTKNSFKLIQVNPRTSEETFINIIDKGKDIFGNIGGNHFIWAKRDGDSLTENSIKLIQAGSPYTIRTDSNITSSAPIASGDNVPTGQAFDASPGESGWYHSRFLGWFWEAQDHWVYSLNFGWIWAMRIYRSGIDAPGGLWFFSDNLGWMWVSEYFRDENDYSSRWGYLIWSQSYNFFLWTKDGNFYWFPNNYLTNQINDNDLGGEIYEDVLGQPPGLKAFILGRGSYADPVAVNGIYVTWDRSKIGEVKKTILDIGVDVPDLGGIGGTSVYENNDITFANIVSWSIVNGIDSKQGKEAVRITLAAAHGIKLWQNVDLGIQGAVYLEEGEEASVEINKKWQTIYVNPDTVELIDSEPIINFVSQGLTANGNAIWDGLPIDVEAFVYEKQLYRTLSVKHLQNNEYEVAGLEYNSSKFDAVDRRGIIRVPALPVPPQANMDKPAAPKNLKIEILH